MTTKFKPAAILPIERFVEVFVAKLVLRGWRSVYLHDLPTQAGLTAIVEVFDDAIAEFEHYGVAWKEIVPWVRVANSLRPSPLGTTENWDHQFQVARGYLTRHSTTHPGIVELMIPRAAAAFELEKLTSDQETLAEATTRRFEIRSRA